MIPMRETVERRWDLPGSPFVYTATAEIWGELFDVQFELPRDNPWSPAAGYTKRASDVAQLAFQRGLAAIEARVTEDRDW